ncbi:hypothetical protein Tco_0164224 [Tanacetum coccineum]
MPMSIAGMFEAYMQKLSAARTTSCTSETILNAEFYDLLNEDFLNLFNSPVFNDDIPKDKQNKVRLEEEKSYEVRRGKKVRFEVEKWFNWRRKRGLGWKKRSE